MATSGLRKDWQQFKQHYPDFAQNRQAKADLGPHLDRMAKVMTIVTKSEAQLDKAMAELAQQCAAIEATLKAYKDAARATRDRDVLNAFEEQRENIVGTCEAFRDTASQWRDFRRGLKEVNL